MYLRPYQPGEAEALWRLLRDSVHRIAIAHYTPAQCDAWAPAAPPQGWGERLQQTPTWVMEAGDKAVGMVALTPAGHIDLLYTAPSHQRRGIARALLHWVEEEARRLDLSHLTTEASLAAHGFFIRHGFEALRCQAVQRHGVELHNWVMSKPLGDDARTPPSSGGTRASASAL